MVRRALNFSARFVCLPTGAISALPKVSKNTTPMKKIVSMTPGRIPAANNCPIDCSVSIPYTMKMVLGGMRMPIAPAEAMEPVERVSL